MQKILNENFSLLKYICSAAMIYLTYKLLGKIIYKTFSKLIKNPFSINKKEIKNNQMNEKEKENLIEIKNSKHILFNIKNEKNLFLEENFSKFPDENSQNKFSILTYNILCQKYMMRRDRKDLKLEYRMEKIKEEISSLDPDIICLQETVFHSIKLYLENFLKSKYEIFYVENYGSSFYNLTAFKKEKFEMKEIKKINLDDIYVEGNRGVFCIELKIKNKNKNEDEKNFNYINNINSSISENLIYSEKNNIKNNEINITNKKENFKSNKYKISHENLDSNKIPESYYINFKNFIENKIENKNKLVIYNVHLPWKPVYDIEKCFILNKIADDVITRNQRNYIILGDFNSKPNSLIMRMLYLDNFIKEIKYFKNIFNFKNEYFKKRNSDEINNKTFHKISDNLVQNKNIENVNNIILNSEQKRISKFTYENINSENFNENKKENQNNTETATLKNENFWIKLYEQKNLENEKSDKLKDFDILKEIFLLDSKLERQKNFYKFDAKEKLILKEFSKILNLSNNKIIFDEVFGNFNKFYFDNSQKIDLKNNLEKNFNFIPNKNNYHYYNKEINDNSDIVNKINSNFLKANSENKFLHDNYYYHNIQQENYLNYKPNVSVQQSESNKEKFLKLKNMIENFKHLFIKYSFRSAYENYQKELRAKLHLIKGIVNSSNLGEKENENNENLPKEKEHIADYFSSHPPYTNFTDNFKDTLDYIFYSKFLVVEKILKLPDYDELILENFLPSSKYCSDHILLYAEFSTN